MKSSQKIERHEEKIGRLVEKMCLLADKIEFWEEKMDNSSSPRRLRFYQERIKCCKEILGRIDEETDLLFEEIEKLRVDEFYEQFDIEDDYGPGW